MPEVNLSDYLADKLRVDYKSLSTLFSATQGRTIENYYIVHKIERVEELLVYDELTFSESLSAWVIRSLPPERCWVSAFCLLRPVAAFVTALIGGSLAGAFSRGSAVQPAESNFKIIGLMCKHCKANVETKLQEVAGVTAVRVDLSRGEAHVGGTADPDEIIAGSTVLAASVSNSGR